MATAGVIADTGYGVGGASQGHDAGWDDPVNLRARIADGVVAVTQACNPMYPGLQPHVPWPATPCNGGL